MRGVGMSMYDETITCLYVRSYLFHMHVRARTRRLYVRPLRKSSRHSSLLQAAHKNFHPHHHHTHPPSKMCFLSSFQSFPFPSADASRIFLFSTIATTIFPEIVFNLPSNVLQLSIAFSFSIIIIWTISSLLYSFSTRLNTLILSLFKLHHLSAAATCPSSINANFTLVGFD